MGSPPHGGGQAGSYVCLSCLGRSLRTCRAKQSFQEQVATRRAEPGLPPPDLPKSALSPAPQSCTARGAALGVQGRGGLRVEPQDPIPLVWNTFLEPGGGA